MVATPKCQAQNPMLCHDPRCPEKRYNLKFSTAAVENARETIRELKKNKQYQGFVKEEADLNYRASVDWYNELLADSRITGAEARKWIEDIDSRYNQLAREKKALEETIDTLEPENNKEIFKNIETIDEKIKTLREEYSDAYHAYYATFDGQKYLFKRLAQARKESPKPKAKIEKIYDQIFAGQNLHKQQIITMIIVDKKNAHADLPVEVKQALDLKVLNDAERKQYNTWVKANPDFLDKTYVSIKKTINDEDEIRWFIKETPTSPEMQIPEYVAKTLYVMPTTTYRGDFIKHDYRKAEKTVNSTLIVDKKKDPSYQTLLSHKYDYDVLVKFEQKLKNKY